MLGIVVVSPASRPAHESLIGRFAKVLGHFTKVSFSLVFFEVFNCPNTLAKRPETSANWLLAKRPVTVLRDREGVRRHRLPFGIDYCSASITVRHRLPFTINYRLAWIIVRRRLPFCILASIIVRRRLPFCISPSITFRHNFSADPIVCLASKVVKCGVKFFCLHRNMHQQHICDDV